MGNGAAMVNAKDQGQLYKYVTEQTAVYGKTWGISMLGKSAIFTSESDIIRDLLNMVLR